LIVVDTNAIVYLLIAGEHTLEAVEVLRKDRD
jgi:predicted nucleic acid-binding protein